MEIPHLNYTIKENSLIEGANHILSAFRPKWNLSDVKFKVFTDGITNKLLGCFNNREKDDVVLIRMYGNNTNLFIDRKNEKENIKRLCEAGFAPAFYGTFENGLVYEYVPGDVLTTVTCRWDTTSTLVARKLADMHRIKSEGIEPEPKLWKILSKYISIIPEKFSDNAKEKKFNNMFFPLKLNVKSEYSFLYRELNRVNNPIVFCHNDLLLGNIIYNSDDGTVTFIDYEYTDYNYQAYDIANHFNEFAGIDTVDYSLFPDETFQRKWLRTYLERFKDDGKGCREVTNDEVENLLLAVNKFTLASHFFWGIWSLLQAEHSSIDFDFMNYAFIRLEAYYSGKKRIFCC